jgi:hypothetical protein
MDLVNRRGIVVAIAVACAAVMIPTIALAAGEVTGAPHGQATPTVTASKPVQPNGPPKCKSSNLEVWLGLNPDGAAAGTTFYPIEFTNDGFRTHTCWLAGSPAVFAINSTGKRIGPVVTASAKGKMIILKAGQTAFARLGIVDAGVISGCTAATGAGLKVTPPGQVASQPILSFTFSVCKNKPFMHVMKLQFGVGIP